MNDSELTRQEKGDQFEECARRVLQNIYEHFGISAFDWRRPGKQWMTGEKGRFKCDIVAYRPDGSRIIFSCKFRATEGAKNSDVGDLLLAVTDIGAEGYLVSNIAPQQTPGLLADAYLAGTIVLDENEEAEQWFARVSGEIQRLFIGWSESALVGEEWEIIARDVNGNIVHRESSNDQSD